MTKEIIEWADYSPIELPPDAVDFFIDQGFWFHTDPNEPEVSYASIIGRNYEEAPIGLRRHRTLFSKQDAWAFRNLGKKNKKAADRATITALQALFGKAEYSDIIKSHMLRGSTSPLRVHFEKDGAISDDVMYVKKPDIHRIMGRFVYELISGLEKHAFLFNEHVFLEEGTAGIPSSDFPKNSFFHSKDYREGVARASIHARFVAMTDSTNLSNLVVNNVVTYLIDFDKCFTVWNESSSNLLMKFQRMYRKYPDMREAAIDETKKVERRVLDNWKALETLGAVLAETRGNYTGLTLNDRIVRLFGYSSFTDYLFGRTSEIEYSPVPVR